MGMSFPFGIEMAIRQLCSPQNQPMNIDVNEHLCFPECEPELGPCRRQLPARFRDLVPEPLPLLPPTPIDSIPSTLNLPSSDLLLSPSQSLPPRIGQMFRTPQNAFGLLRQYYSNQPPSHDPEENNDLFNLTDYPTNSPGSSRHNSEPSEPSFHPFPNKSSFLLGEWYWNHGVQKSRESFRELLGIIGDTNFHPEDVQHTKWGKIDNILARNNFDMSGDGFTSTDNDLEEWMDEDAGWQKTPITISVPFHHRWKRPGPQDFLVGDLYHRSFVSVIREKLANKQENQHFHYEPFVLLWKPVANHIAEIRVHGELYTSPVFVEAHRELQDSPKEPGCDLPRAIVAMMFWSDATHLTSFGNTKLWPSYLFFGNESKYHRCKPTCNLCSHVAYFQTVRHSLFITAFNF